MFALVYYAEKKFSGIFITSEVSETIAIGGQHDGHLHFWLPACLC